MGIHWRWPTLWRKCVSGCVTIITIISSIIKMVSLQPAVSAQVLFHALRAIRIGPSQHLLR